MVPCETGIVGQDFLSGRPVGEEFECIGHLDKHATDTRLSAALAGLDGDSRMEWCRHAPEHISGLKGQSCQPTGVPVHQLGVASRNSKASAGVAVTSNDAAAIGQMRHAIGKRLIGTLRASGVTLETA